MLKAGSVVFPTVIAAEYIAGELVSRAEEADDPLPSIRVFE